MIFYIQLLLNWNERIRQRYLIHFEQFFILSASALPVDFHTSVHEEAWLHEGGTQGFGPWHYFARSWSFIRCLKQWMIKKLVNSPPLSMHWCKLLTNHHLIMIIPLLLLSGPHLDDPHHRMTLISMYKKHKTFCAHSCVYRATKFKFSEKEKTKIIKNWVHFFTFPYIHRTKHEIYCTAE